MVFSGQLDWQRAISIVNLLHVWWTLTCRTNGMHNTDGWTHIIKILSGQFREPLPDNKSSNGSTHQPLYYHRCLHLLLRVRWTWHPSGDRSSPETSAILKQTYMDGYGDAGVYYEMKWFIWHSLNMPLLLIIHLVAILTQVSKGWTSINTMIFNYYLRMLLTKCLFIYPGVS